LDEARADLALAQSEVAAKENELEAARQSTIDQAMELEAARQAADAHVYDIEAARAEIATLHMSLASAKGHVVELEGQLAGELPLPVADPIPAEAQLRMDELEAELMSVEQAAEQLDETVATIDGGTKPRDLIERIEQLEAELAEATSQEGDPAEVESLREDAARLADLEAEAEALRDLAAKVPELEERLSATENAVAQVEDLEERLRSADTEAKRMTDELERSQDSALDAEKRAAALEEKVSLLQGQVEKAAERAADARTPRD